MKIEALHVGMKVRHPFHGEGVVKAITETIADIDFSGNIRKVSPETSDLKAAEPQAVVEGLTQPLSRLIEETVEAVIRELGVELPSESVFMEQLGPRWNGGTLVLRPADPTLATKEVPLETFFHKVVMMRNNLRVLEQKINGHALLNDGEKVEMQQYITRCYGSMTTFNILFKNEGDQFRTGA